MPPTHLSVAVPGHDRFDVYLDGKLIATSDCIEAKAGIYGFVIRRVYGLDGKPAFDEEGKPRTRVQFGKVHFVEKPRR